MNKIGTFRKAGLEYVGEVITLSVQNRDVRILPVETVDVDGPTHTILVGSANLGRAWRQGEACAAEWLIVHLDDPSFVEEIEAELRPAGEDRYELYWARRK